MTPIADDLAKRIRTTLAAIGSAPLRQGVTELLAVLGYRSELTLEVENVRQLLELSPPLTEKQHSLFGLWSNARGLFQFTAAEMPVAGHVRQRRAAIDQPQSLLFLAAELTPWKASDRVLAAMTRVVNRIFAVPVVVTYRYRCPSSAAPRLAVGVVHRRVSKKDRSRDVLERHAVVSDVRTNHPSPADIELLAGLSLERIIRVRGVRRVDHLHLAWERALRTSRALDSFDPHLLYLRDVERHPLIEGPRVEREIARKARAGDRLAADRLATANLRFVISYVKKYRGHGLDLADLVCVGNQGLLKAVRKFDPNKNVRFISYAVWWIRQTVLQALAEQTRPVRVPLNQNSNLVELSSIESALKERLDRSPTDWEIAEEMEESVEVVRALRRVASPELSFDAPPDTSGPQRAAFGDPFSVTADEDIEEDGEDQARREFLAKMFERHLTERERKILVLYYGLDDGEDMTLEEIGSLLGVTRERIRQIRNRAFEKLRASPDGKALEGFW